ncbi:hypothetical protein [Microvirga massiliensis]|uniref:hypothetical protein n=1 Tax=Microvirga massiliensis TaxID=1033741 RepID=UPI00062B84C0|nr:hypothetical protein [Microvirga massiliensis]
MILDVLVAILAAVAGFLAAIWLLVLWAGERTGAAFDRSPEPLDPIIGPRDRIVICDGGEPFIPMPEHLRTQDEMIAWMTKELPKLTARETP